MRAGIVPSGDGSQSAAIGEAAAILSESGLRAILESRDEGPDIAMFRDTLAPIGDGLEGPTVERRVRNADLEHDAEIFRATPMREDDLAFALEQLELDDQTIAFSGPVRVADLRRLALAWAERKGWRAVEAADLRPGVVDETGRWRIPRCRVADYSTPGIGMSQTIEFEIEELDPTTGEVVKRHAGFEKDEFQAAWSVTQAGE